MCNIRIIVCPQCGGDGGGESPPYGYNPYDGSLLTGWIECKACDGEGYVIDEVLPCTDADLDMLDELGALPGEPVSRLIIP